MNVQTAAPTLLLVEDSADDVLFVRRALAKIGCSLHLAVAEDGEQAVRYLRGEGEYADRAVHPLPNVVLLDWKLPRMSGIEVLEWIRQQSSLRNMPVIVLTSSRQQENIDRAYRACANSYLQKPVAFDDLTALMKKICEYWLDLNITGSDSVR